LTFDEIVTDWSSLKWYFTTIFYKTSISSSSATRHRNPYHQSALHFVLGVKFICSCVDVTLVNLLIGFAFFSFNFFSILSIGNERNTCLELYKAYDSYNWKPTFELCWHSY